MEPERISKAWLSLWLSNASLPAALPKPTRVGFIPGQPKILSSAAGPVPHVVAGMDGNRTHQGRLSTAPQTVLKTAGDANIKQILTLRARRSRVLGRRTAILERASRWPCRVAESERRQPPSAGNADAGEPRCPRSPASTSEQPDSFRGRFNKPDMNHLKGCASQPLARCHSGHRRPCRESSGDQV